MAPWLTRFGWRWENGFQQAPPHQEVLTDVETRLVAGRPKRMIGVAAARLAAASARHVPGVGRALIAVLTGHIRQTVTLAAAAVALAVVGGRAGGRLTAQVVANTLWGQR